MPRAKDRGRPHLPIKERLRNIVTFAVTDRQLDSLRRISRTRGVSIGEVIRSLLDVVES